MPYVPKGITGYDDDDVGWTTEKLWTDFWHENRDFFLLDSIHTSSCSMGTGYSFSLGHVNDNSSPSRSKFRNE
jgi:hypothetical protein